MANLKSNSPFLSIKDCGCFCHIHNLVCKIDNNSNRNTVTFKVYLLHRAKLKYNDCYLGSFFLRFLLSLNDWLSTLII